MNIKSERLKKLETELHDLEQWLKLGLVPKKDIAKHREEILALQDRVQEEKERLRILKESGEVEEQPLPKRPPHGRQAYQEPATMPDLELAEESGMTDAGLEMETESFELETSAGEETEEASGGEEAEVVEEEEEEDPFSDRNRWRRGVLEDPDSSEW